MDGVIAYIGNISSGTGTTGLQQIEDDYLTAASTIPLMTTNDEIASARDDDADTNPLFSDETNAQLVMFNGSIDDMRASIATSEQAADASIRNINASLWLARDSARLTLFDADSEQRAFLLRNLDRTGDRHRLLPGTFRTGSMHNGQASGRPVQQLRPRPAGRQTPISGR